MNQQPVVAGSVAVESRVVSKGPSFAARRCRREHSRATLRTSASDFERGYEAIHWVYGTDLFSSFVVARNTSELGSAAAVLSSVRALQRKSDGAGNGCSRLSAPRSYERILIGP